MVLKNFVSPEENPQLTHVAMSQLIASSQRQSDGIFLEGIKVMESIYIININL